jgi:hypothetical protein
MIRVFLTKKVFTAMRRPAFSLVAVLIIAMIAMGILGGVMFSLDSTYFTLRGEKESLDERVLLENAVEKARAFLKKTMMERAEVIRWKDSGRETITSLNDLSLYASSEDVSAGSLKGSLYVNIYDMQYKVEDLDSGLREDERLLLPPASILTGGDGEETDTDVDPSESLEGGVSEPIADANTKTGSYLIRATFVNGGDGGQKTVEVALLQGTKN